MKIEKSNDIESNIESFIDIAEQVRLKYRPEASPETRERFDDLIKQYYSNTQFGTDVIFACNEEGKRIAFAALMKGGDITKPWAVSYNVYPEYDTAEVANLLFPEIICIAQEQNASTGLTTAHRNDQTHLQKVIESQHFIADHYGYKLSLNNLDNLPQIEIPEGYSFEKNKQITDPIQYVNVLNGVYKNFEGFEPDTPETIKNWETMERKRFDIVHYYVYEGKTLVGLCTVEDNLDETLNRRIDSIGVLENHRNKGIGSALMSMALRDLREKGRKKVNIWTSGKTAAAIGLPLKFGFEIDKSNSSVQYILKNN
ncbi:MAG: GNAT family N-acetyltransferase [Promethearchaeota archaeon]